MLRDGGKKKNKDAETSGLRAGRKGRREGEKCEMEKEMTTDERAGRGREHENYCFGRDQGRRERRDCHGERRGNCYCGG